MKNHSPYIGIAVVVVLTLISGLVHGMLSNRFGPPADMVAATEDMAKLRSILENEGFGDWKMVKFTPMHKRVTDTLECAAYINGTFVNQITRQTVNGFIVLGPPGPISVHTPEVCYSSRDFDIKGKRKHVAIKESKDGGKENVFWSLTMRSTDVNADMLRVYYAWGNDGTFQAPESPRMKFGFDKMLYKIQLAAYLPPDADLSKNDTCRSFLEALLPVANPILLERSEEKDSVEKSAAG